ncbi:hypothetical protein IHV25_07555 [Phaeovibrio sulfidiphilus]|uniref:Uncharacterized protein n=1 Tax=Phaeovibrio sulfidiphilus TaxID=1220600 RepID=A0A8J7CPV4_9PROT|nr:hypothetical protein [Phaeovibrio sulfidiphilus]MBE1237502.1 hypothetical protein [Phaeovibrio sulfidiphilus]
MDVRNPALLAVALVCAGLVAWSYSLSRDLEAAAGRERSLRSANAALVVTLEAVRTDARKAVETLESVHAAEKKRTEALHAAMREIENAPEGDNGPVAPVLRRALERVRTPGCGDGALPAPGNP